MKAKTGKQGVAVDSIPVDVAAKIVQNILTEALSGRGRFALNHEDGSTYIRWGMVQNEIHRSLQDASSETMVWSGQHEPQNERRVRLLDQCCRNWPEPAKSQAISILANIDPVTRPLT